MNAQQSVDKLDRQLKALELRKAGVGYKEIAQALGYAYASGAYSAVMHALKLVKREPAKEIIALEAERLDKLQQALWAQAIKGNHGAVDRIIRVMERRAKLLGLDAPAKIAPTNPDGDKEYGAAERYLLSKLLSDATDGDPAIKAAASDAKAEA